MMNNVNGGKGRKKNEVKSVQKNAKFANDLEMKSGH